MSRIIKKYFDLNLVNFGEPKIVLNTIPILIFLFFFCLKNTHFVEIQIISKYTLIGMQNNKFVIIIAKFIPYLFVNKTFKLYKYSDIYK